MTERQNTALQERMTIIGHFDPAAFEPWIRRHALKLGLSQVISRRSRNQIELLLEGPEELIDMMEMGCSLGPIDAWVDRIDRQAIDREMAE